MDVLSQDYLTGYLPGSDPDSLLDTWKPSQITLHGLLAPLAHLRGFPVGPSPPGFMSSKGKTALSSVHFLWTYLTSLPAKDFFLSPLFSAEELDGSNILLKSN